LDSWLLQFRTITLSIFVTGIFDIFLTKQQGFKSNLIVAG